MRIGQRTVSHGQLSGITTDQHHDQAHTVVSHSDTTGTGAELDSLTDGSEVTLHSHPSSEVVIKLAGEVVNNSSVLQDDNELFTPIAANEDIVVEFYLRVQTGSTSDIQVAIAVPAGAGLVVRAWAIGANGVGDYGGVTISGGGIGLDTSDASVGVIIAVAVRNGGTAGDIQLRWAQRIAVAENTIVDTFSYLIAHREV